MLSLHTNLEINQLCTSESAKDPTGEQRGVTPLATQRKDPSYPLCCGSLLVSPPPGPSAGSLHPRPHLLPPCLLQTPHPTPCPAIRPGIALTTDNMVSLLALARAGPSAGFHPTSSTWDSSTTFFRKSPGETTEHQEAPPQDPTGRCGATAMVQPHCSISTYLNTRLPLTANSVRARTAPYGLPEPHACLPVLPACPAPAFTRQLHSLENAEPTWRPHFSMSHCPSLLGSHLSPPPLLLLWSPGT